jgi:hypothetical protein
MPDLLNLPQDIQLANKIIDSENEITKKKVDNGLLGLFWGTSACIPNNIAAFSIILLLLFGIIYSLIVMKFSDNNITVISIKDCWSIITPIITLAFGYLFGDKNKKNAF